MSKSDPLTKRQRDLLRDLHSLAELFGLDYTNIQEYERDARTPFLEVMKRLCWRKRLPGTRWSTNI
jgi:hypothetical protein